MLVVGCAGSEVAVTLIGDDCGLPLDRASGRGSGGGAGEAIAVVFSFCPRSAAGPDSADAASSREFVRLGKPTATRTVAVASRASVVAVRISGIRLLRRRSVSTAWAPGC